MKKLYLNQNVYEALQERLSYIFQEFEHVYVSFSGGKDSGLLLNLVLDYLKAHDSNRKVGLFHQDFEAQYQATTDYVTYTFAACLPYVEPYWVCLPMGSKTPLSNYELYWYPWDDQKKEVWVRPMPNLPCVVNLENNPFDFYQYKMLQEDLARQFGGWYRETHGGGKTIGLLGLRADESLNRYRGIVTSGHTDPAHPWISRGHSGAYTASPLYDWTTDDVWTANARFGYDYNRLYDMFYKAGLSPAQMRVASPFNEWAVQALNLYRVIEPETWAKLVGRVQGANFASIYGKSKAMGYRSISLPPGHTWKSYTLFLLSTLPAAVRDQYLDKFHVSQKFWNETGGGLSEDTIREIEEKGYHVRRNGVSNYSKDSKSRLIFEGELPDDTDDIQSTTDIPSWKRMCYCILKNDHNCRFMGFGNSREQQKRINAIKEKYRSIIKGGTEHV